MGRVPGQSGSVNIHFSPLEQGTTSACERYFKNLTLQRVERGDKDATMLAICYDDRQSVPTKFFVVSMDKSGSDHSLTEWLTLRRMGNYGRIPRWPPFSLMEDVLSYVLIQARDMDINFWKAKFINKCVDEFFKNLV